MSETPATTTESSVTTQQCRAVRTATGEGPGYWFFGALAVIRSPEGARPIVIEMTVPPGGHTPLHVHTTLDDNFYLLSGRMAVRSGDETFVAHAGDYVSQPTGMPHTFFALDEKLAVLLQTHANDDCLDHSSPPGSLSGREGVKQFFTMFHGAFPDLKYTIEDQVAEEDRVVTRHTWHGTHKGAFLGIPPTGKQVAVAGIDITRWAGGKAVEHWGSQDTLGLMQQLGVIPPPGQQS